MGSRNQRYDCVSLVSERFQGQFYWERRRGLEEYLRDQSPSKGFGLNNKAAPGDLVDGSTASKASHHRVQLK